MNRFFINRTMGVSCQNFRVLHRAYALIQRGQLRTATLASAFVSSSYASNTLTTHAYSVMLPLYFVHTLLCVNMNRFFINRTIGVSCQNFRVLHSAYALIQYADNAYCYTSLRIRFIVLCQQYSDYTCILSNAPAIFCAYIIVRKYEPFFY